MTRSEFTFAQVLTESRLYRNALVFLAADKTRLQDLDEAARRYLAWESILAETNILNLDPQQVRQAETQKTASDGAVTARIPETYQWILVPVQKNPQAAMEWQAIKVSAQAALAVRASKKLRDDELLITGFASKRLKMELDRVPLWRGDSVSIKQLVEDFARYTYLPRLRNPAVLFAAIQDGLSLLLWQQDSFAYADSYDEAAERYRGLRCGKLVSISEANASGLIVRPEVAYKQYRAETEKVVTAGGTAGGGGVIDGGSGGKSPTPDGGKEKEPEPRRVLKRFHGSVSLDPTRAGRDAGRIADEVIAHLISLAGSDVKVTLEISADLPAGAPDNVVRTVTENARTLKFSDQGFESD